MYERIKEVVDRIFLESNSKVKSLSLMSGNSGVSLFNFLYIKHLGTNDLYEGFTNLNAEIIDKMAEGTYSNFCTGKAGINWLFVYFHENGILEKDDLDIICSDSVELENVALEMLKRGFYDFLHGAIGIGYYLLYKEKSQGDLFFSKFFSILKSLMRISHNGSYFPDYDFKIKKSINNQSNLSLSHGMSSILKFCLQCYKQNIQPAIAKTIANDIVNYLISNINKNTNISYFPNIINVNTTNVDQASRLAWCYGDLSIAFVLYQFSVIFNNKKVLNFSLKVLMRSTYRRNFSETKMWDAGICHGSSGVAHIYKKMWIYTKNDLFKESCDFWISKTLDFANSEKNIGIYQSYDAINNKYEDNNTFLEGACGIGLVLLSYLTNDFSWDYSIMLND